MAEIAIIGAGMGGLVTALALARAGRAVTVYEQAARLGELGAGITLSPNAVRVIDWLGLGEEAHLNTPGRLGGNWTWRAAAGFDTAALAKEIRGECEVVCRA